MLDETIDYLSKQEIGVIISQGLAETYRCQPKNPVDFLGKWLLHNTEREGQREVDEIRNSHIQELIGHHLRNLKISDMEEKELQAIQKLKDDKQSAFFKKVNESDDHEEILQDLSNYIQEYTQSTSVYVAKLVEEKNPIELDDDDTAHIKDDAGLYLDIYHSSPKGFEFLLRKTIKSSEGVVHAIFQEREETPAEPQDTQAEGEGETEPAPVEEYKPQHVSVDEIVREHKLKFFKVPRLGSLLCVRLSYES